MAATSDLVAAYQFQYDNLDRMTHETQTIIGLAPDVKTCASYDRVGNRVWLAAGLITGSGYIIENPLKLRITIFSAEGHDLMS